MGNKIKNRNEIDQKYKWKIEEMYADAASWEKGYPAGPRHDRRLRRLRWPAYRKRRDAG